jgi:Tol biopolymer transport system component
MDRDRRPASHRRTRRALHVLYGNRGNVDAKIVPIRVRGIPPGAEVTVKPHVVAPQDETGDDSPSVDTDDGKTFSLVIPNIAPGQIGLITFDIGSPGESFPLEAEIGAPLVDQDTLRQEAEDCILAALAAALPFGRNCLLGLVQHVAKNILTARAAAAQPLDAISFTALLFDLLVAAPVELIEQCGSDLQGWPALMKAAVKKIAFALSAYDIFQECKVIAAEAVKALLAVTVVVSADPNDKAGPSGTGPEQHVAPDKALAYAVSFENKPEATAPAQEVVVTDRLDPATMDMDTLGLGPIAFGDMLVRPAPGLSSFATEVDLRPERNLFVRVSAELDRTTGVLTWRLVSIDPATGEPPEDPLAGFLPPNARPPEGEGTVLFTVMPRDGLATGTVIDNAAEIVFDVNAPISTSTWLNTIDATPPVSEVQALPSNSPAEFRVDWSGTDVGAGVLDYTLFVSEDDAPFEAWLRNTDANAGTFQGQEGHRYAFYSVARDAAGNREKAPTASDSATSVRSALAPPVALGQFAGDGTTAIPVGGTTAGTEVRFAGTLTSPTARDVRLEVEAKPVGAAFDGAGTASSALVSGGRTASVTISDLGFQGYHWRARTVDEAGAVSDWATFGGNADSEADFQVRADVLFASTRTGNGDIYAVDPGGGTARQLTAGSAIDAEPEWSPDRSKVAFTSTREGNVEIHVMDADGSDVTRLTNHAAIDTSPAWSPDATRLAIASNRAGGNWDIYLIDAEDGGNLTRLMTHHAVDSFPAWSPDGTKLAFTSGRSGGGDIYTMDAAGMSPTRRTTSPASDTEPAWSGSTIAFSTNRHGSANFDIYTMNDDGTGQTRRTAQRGHDITPSWAPGGGRLAFATNRTGNFDIFTMSADGSEQTALTAHPALDAVPDW